MISRGDHIDISQGGAGGVTLGDSRRLSGRTMSLGRLVESSARSVRASEKSVPRRMTCASCGSRPVVMSFVSVTCLCLIGSRRTVYPEVPFNGRDSVRSAS